MNNTRPITLLETTQKALVRLLNNRLAKIFVDNNVLRGNQYAGLPGNSTFEPLRILNTLMEDAHEKKNEIWVLFQDLSKAYDRININMLKKSLYRLKLPVLFSDFIENIFTNRTNRVFTEVGLTNSFDMLVGIDQGKVISPLLWCIYYDPLLCEVEKLQIGYDLDLFYKKDLYSGREAYLSETVSDMAFMDDTTWITNDKESLEKILEIADSYYDLTSIKVNKQKSELLVYVPDDPTIYDQPVILTFGRDQISIQPKKHNESARILGAWVNLAGSNKFVNAQLRNEVLSFCNTLKRKHITDKQLLYLWNMVVIPRLEYRSQLTVLDYNDCHKITSPFRKFFKNKLNLSISAPNAIMESNLIYNFRDFYEVQLQSKISNFMIQVNDTGLLGRLTDIRLRQLQQREWLHISPLLSWPHRTIKPSHKTSFLHSILTLCFQNNFSFDVSLDRINRILGGYKDIRSILGTNLDISDHRSMRTQQILYLEQVTSLNGSYLLPWTQVCAKRFSTSPSRRTPAWFYKLESFLLNQSMSRRITSRDLIIPATNLKGHVASPVDVSRSNKEWISVWNPSYNLTSLGRAIHKDTVNVLVEHWIESPEFPQRLIRCSGCYLNNTFTYVSNNITAAPCQCSSFYPLFDVIIFQQTANKKHSNNTYFFKTPFFVAYQLAEFHWKFYHNILPFYDDRQIIFHPENFISRYIQHGIIASQLIAIQQSFLRAPHLEFYIDGSLVNVGRESMSMSCAFIQSDSSFPFSKFVATLERFPSSTRAESFAALAALLTAPFGCHVDIYTDSAAVISLSSQHVSTTRSFFKDNNNITWAMIRDLISSMSLTVTFHKVKAHSGIQLNDEVDSIASSAHFDNTNLLELINIGQQQISVIPKWRNITIDQHLRHFITSVSRSKGFEKWFNLFRNTKYRSQYIDWDATFFLLNSDNDKLHTSFTSSRRKVRKLKLLIEEILTVEHVKKRLPEIYKDWYCPRCNIDRETFQHVWLCSCNNLSLFHIMESFKYDLMEIIQLYNPQVVQQYLDHNTLWNISDSIVDLTFIDIVKGFVPGFLTDCLYMLFNNRQLVLDTLLIFYNNLFNSIDDKIWRPRCDAMILKERSLNINNRIKKKKSRFQHSNPIPSTSRCIATDDMVDSEFGLELEIRLGGNWLGFTMLFNRCSF